MLAARYAFDPDDFDPDDIAAFLALPPRKHDGLALRHVIEPRHESFRDERFFDLPLRHDAAVVSGDDEESPCRDADTASFAYACVQRMREEVATSYDEPALVAFGKRARRWASAGRDSYIFIINGPKLRAPAAASALQQRLGIAPA